MTSNMVKERKPGENKEAKQPPTLDNSTKERKTVKVDFSGKTVLTMMVILLMDTSWGMEGIILLI